VFENTMTGNCFMSELARILLSTSTPDIFGSIKSNNTRSGLILPTISIPLSPSAAISAS